MYAGVNEHKNKNKYLKTNLITAKLFLASKLVFLIETILFEAKKNKSRDW